MTETLAEETYLEPEDRPTLGREYRTVEIGSDGRNVEMLCVPFDTPATVVDPPPAGDGQPYKEAFARGAFSGAVKAPNRVLLEFEHFHPGLSGVIGRGDHLEEADDGLYGRFRVLKQPDGDKALELIHEDVLNAASVFFQPIKHARTPEGIVKRLRVRLDRVALCRVGTWPEAKVLAVRSGAEIDDEDIKEPEPVLPRLGFDDKLAARMERAGIAVPDRLKTVTLPERLGEGEPADQ